MSFLSKLSQLKSVPTVSTENKPKLKAVNDEVSLLPKHYVRDEDPAVRRLKELRRKETLAKEASNPSKKKRESRSSGAKTKSPSSRSRTKAKDELGSAVGTVYKRRIGSGSRRQKLDLATHKHAPIKIMSFEELMKQADSNAVEEKSVSRTSSPVNVAGTKLEKPGFKSKLGRSSSLNPQSTSRSRSRSPPAPRSSMSPRSGEVKSNRTEEQHAPRGTHTGSRPARGKVGSDEQGDRLVRVPIPKNIVSQPNKKLKEKLRRNRGNRESYDRYRNEYGREEEEGDDYSDLDGFIEDDEEEWSGRGGHAGGRDEGYDKDEIWAMFNRGKRRSDYNYYDDYDEDDDMEANEMEILEEEEESRKVARMEDKREEEWLRRHEMEKKRRKQRR